MSQKAFEAKVGKKIVILSLVAILLAFAASPAFALYPVPGVSPDAEAGSVSCTGNAEALARLQNAQSADDPAFGASSLAEAKFYAAQYCGAGSTVASGAAWWSGS